MKEKKYKPKFGINLNNADKSYKNFMYQNLTKSNSFNCNFSESNFDYVCFRGAHFKSCKFNGSRFVRSEFIGSNLKGSSFIKAIFDNTVFEGARLVDVDFKGATFTNTIFLETDLSGAKNLNLDDENIRVYAEMPQIELSEALSKAIEHAMTSKFIKKSRTLDTRDGSVNYLSVIILLENFEEEVLIKGLENIDQYIDREFYTLSFIITLINKMLKEENI